MTNATHDAFLEGLRKSEIPAVDQLDDWLAQNDDPNPVKLASALVRDGLLTRWQAKYLLSGRHVLMIGSYQLLERIGRDAWGDLFVAEHRQLSRKVQIRFLPTELSKAQTALNRFLERVGKASQLDHPHVVHVMDVDRQQGRYYLITEHVDATPSHQYAFTGTGLAKVLGQAVDALIAIHRAGLVHGHLDENAMLVSPNGDLKIGNLVTPSSPGASEASDPAVDFDRLALSAIRLGKSIDDDPAARSVIELMERFVAGNVDTETLKNELQQIAHAEKGPLGDLKLAPAFDRPAEMQQKSLPGLPMESVKKRTPAPRPTGRKPPPNRRFLKRVNPTLLVGGIVVGSLILLALTIYAATTFLSPPVVDQPDTESTKPPRTAAVRPKPAKPELLDGKLDDIDPNQPMEERVGKIPAKPPGATTAPPDDAAPTQSPPSTPEDQTAAAATNMEPGMNDGAQASGTEAPIAAGDRSAPGDTPAATASDPTGGLASDVDASSAPGGDGPMDSDTSESQELDAPASAQNQPPATATNPLGNLPATIDLPPSDDTTETVIGSVLDAGNFLLGLRLITGPEISRGKVFFELAPNHEGDLRRWDVVYRRRESDPGTTVARFSLSQQQLRFQWTEEAKGERNADYLRNTVVKAQLGKETREIGLRSPVSIPDFKLTSEKPQVRVDVPVEFLPDTDALTIELGDLPEESFGPVVVDQSVIARKKPATIFFSSVDYEQMVAIQVSADIRSRIRLNAGAYLRIVPGDRPVLAKPTETEQAMALLIQISQSMKLDYQQFRAARTDDIRNQLLAQKRIRDGSEFTWEQKRAIEDKMKTDSELAAERASKFQTQVTEYLPKWFDRPIPIVISFKLGDRTIVLARSSDDAGQTARDVEPAAENRGGE